MSKESTYPKRKKYTWIKRSTNHARVFNAPVGGIMPHEEKNMFTRNDLITAERLAFLRENRTQKREENFKKLIPVMGRDAVDEIRNIYDMFDEKMLIWYASLYDPDIGGFYFSNSARDTEGFLPDIESTAQALNFITEISGICKGGERLIKPKSYGRLVIRGLYRYRGNLYRRIPIKSVYYTPIFVALHIAHRQWVSHSHSERAGYMVGVLSRQSNFFTVYLCLSYKKSWHCNSPAKFS